MAKKKLSKTHKENISNSMKYNFNGHGNKGRIGIMKGKKHKDISKIQISETRKRLFSEKKIESWNKGLTAKEDSRIVSGEKYWNWKGGITPELKMLRNSSMYKIWREIIFLRDNFTCQECGQFGGFLEAHHIKSFALFPELRFKINNGITYCTKCHIKIDKYRGVRIIGKSS